VDLLKIAKILDVSIHYETFDDEISGVLIRNESGNAIGVNKKHSKVRQRFTIAHEFGHLQLHEGLPIRVDRSFRINWRRADQARPRDIEEIEANSFAAKLLMPTSMITSAHSSASFELEDDAEVKRLAGIFGVSTQAMTFRLSQLLNGSTLG
jgi:Zn-dependent peptidase ImmA (M78 family)